MTEAEIEEICTQVLAEPLPPEMAKVAKKLEGIVNMFVGQVLRELKTADPKAVRAAVLKILNEDVWT